MAVVIEFMSELYNFYSFVAAAGWMSVKTMARLSEY